MKILGNPFFITGLLILITIIVTGQNLLLEKDTFESGGIGYTHYNNYLIFKQSFFHLIENMDLYQLYPNEHWDYFKYSPTFSLLIAPLAILPDTFGLFIWNLLNVLVLFYALWKLPFQSDKTRLFMIAFILIELIESIQNSQSNGLIAGLIVFAFVFLEKKQSVLASLFIVMTIFIKLFGLVSIALLILYPDKLKLITYTICWTLIFAILPLIVISIPQLSFLNYSWVNLLQQDHSISWGLSVAGLLHSWFGVEHRNVILIIGVGLFCLPFLKYKFFCELKFRLFFLSSILIWIVIFNYKAEAPTFIIAISGVIIWFVSQKIKTENVILLITTFILTAFSATDIFPNSVRANYFEAYVLKALPYILIWLKIIYDLTFYRSENDIVHDTLPNVLTVSN